MLYWLLEGKIKLFLLPSPTCNVVPLFEIPIVNNKHLNFEWRGGGGVLIPAFVLCSYLFEYNVSTILSPIVCKNIKSWKWAKVKESWGRKRKETIAGKLTKIETYRCEKIWLWRRPTPVRLHDWQGGTGSRLCKGGDGESKSCSLRLSWRNVNQFSKRHQWSFYKTSGGIAKFWLFPDTNHIINLTLSRYWSRFSTNLVSDWSKLWQVNLCVKTNAASSLKFVYRQLKRHVL